MRRSLLKFFLISFASIHILKFFLISLLLNKLTSSSLIILNLEILLRFLLQKLIVWIYLVINKSSWISWWKKLNHWTLVKAKTSLFYLLAVNQWVNSYILMIGNLLILKAILIILRHFIKKIVLCAIDQIILIKLWLFDLLKSLSFHILKWLFLIKVYLVLWVDICLILKLINWIPLLIFLIILCLQWIDWLKLILVKLFSIIIWLKLQVWIELLILSLRKSSVITLSLILIIQLVLRESLNLLNIILLSVKNRLRLYYYFILI